MTITKSAEMVCKVVDVFRCPICKSPMKVVDLKSLICSNRHTFDFAKQGYVNMLIRSVKSHYDKKLFEARHKIIKYSNLYALLHNKISEVIKQHLHTSNGPNIVLDAGCGEGSHLQGVIDKYDNAMVGIGVDISKEGIVLAAKNYKSSIWLVGDLANSPLADQSCQVILNILSPANYTEFKRVLLPEGLIIKVVPHTNYLKELRDTFFGGTEKQTHNNDETVSLFKQHFKLVDNFNLSYTKELDRTELLNLVHMSPLAWNMEKEHIDDYVDQVSSEITIDLSILVGINESV